MDRFVFHPRGVVTPNRFMLRKPGVKHQEHNELLGPKQQLQNISLGF